MLRKLYDYKGTQESFRTNQNNVMFLVADEEQAENMINVARITIRFSSLANGVLLLSNVP
jgi:hypothetical protein